MITCHFKFHSVYRLVSPQKSTKPIRDVHSRT